MAQIIISSRDSAEAAFERFRAAAAITIAEPGEAAPACFGALPADRHLVLFDDCDHADDCEDGQARARRIIDFARALKPGDDILIHCHRGVARSTATAFIILCALNEDADEASLAALIRNAAPHADPNLLLVSEADRLLDRDDRMVNAVLDMSCCAGAIGDDVVRLPLHP